MNIGIVTTWFERGAAYVSRAYYDCLKKNNKVFIYARGGEKYAIGDPAWDKVYVTWGKRYKDSSCRINWLHFKRWVTVNNIEIVIFNEQQDWEIVVDCRNLGVKTVAYVDYYTSRTVPFFNIYDAVICHTRKHFSVFKDHHKAFYIPWGTDIDLFSPRDCSRHCDSELVFFHSAGMGGIGLRKGTDLLVRAFDRLIGDARLIIHSQVPVETYSAVVDIIKNNNRIDFIYKTVPAPGLYHLGDVYVYPSRLEGLGLTLMEALASGLPVITTNCAPMNEFVEDGFNGLLVDVEAYLGRIDGYYWAESHCSLDSLIEKMQMLVENRGMFVEMKKNSRDYAIKKLNWEENSVLLEECVQEIKSIDYNSDASDILKKSALYESYSKRINGLSLKKRIIRKIYRNIMSLSF